MVRQRIGMRLDAKVAEQVHGAGAVAASILAEGGAWAVVGAAA
jgi:hypothetical protein